MNRHPPCDCGRIRIASCSGICYNHKIPYLICMGFKPKPSSLRLWKRLSSTRASRPSGHGGSTYIRCGDELRAVLTLSVGRNYPLIFPRQGWCYILNPNAQSEDKRAWTNPILAQPPLPAAESSVAPMYLLHVSAFLIRSLCIRENRRSRRCNKYQNNVNYSRK